jgi:hypothetical protein
VYSFGLAAGLPTQLVGNNVNDVVRTPVRSLAGRGKLRGGQFKDWIHAVSFSADGRWLAAADMAGGISVWTFPA